MKYNRVQVIIRVMIAMARSCITGFFLNKFRWNVLKFPGFSRSPFQKKDFQIISNYLQYCCNSINFCANKYSIYHVTTSVR